MEIMFQVTLIPVSRVLDADVGTFEINWGLEGMSGNEKSFLHFAPILYMTFLDLPVQHFVKKSYLRGYDVHSRRCHTITIDRLNEGLWTT